MNKRIFGAAALLFTLSTPAAHAHPPGQSPALRQALDYVLVQQQQRMRAELRTSWVRMRDQLAQAQVASQKPAATENATVRAAP